SVYGNGPGLDDDYSCPDPGPPDRGLYDGIRMRVGKNAEGDAIPGVMIPPDNDLARDLPRIGPLLAAHVITEDDIPKELQGNTAKENETRAFIGDLRNDENLIVAQFHLAVLRFHNKVVDAVEADPAAFGVAGASDAQTFAVVQRLVRYHYQWLVINDFLR